MLKLYIFICLFCINLGCNTDTAQQKIATSAQMLVSAHKTTRQPSNTVSVAYLMGKFDPAQHPDFVLIDKKYALSDNMYLRKETYDAFRQMYEAAAKEGIVLKVRSAARSFNQQKGIWEAKWTGKRKLENGQNAARAYKVPYNRARKILEYSAMPGTSRHHWGTDLDLKMLTNDYYKKGEGLSIYTWMQQNAPAYGFCQPYTTKDNTRPNGYNEERWHWSFAPLSKTFTAQYVQQITADMINGFTGAETAAELHIIEQYVQGIHDDCL
ncbi:MAG: M15 family metallopeptidase [Saprospiraceae bacterium]|nr:M15 family metallopeptidase [Saprospiraceae bacterium]MBP7680053.1 M15 family metallopeptidase [Saprospiraceae bacterium]